MRTGRNGLRLLIGPDRTGLLPEVGVNVEGRAVDHIVHAMPAPST